jgi:non-heme chloroperoxidase
MPHPVFQTRDGRLALSVFGPEDGRPIVFLHGGGQTRHAWSRSASLLGERGWRAIAADLRGHGDSDWTGKYLLADFAGDVVELAHAQREKPVLVGASLGGLSSLLANATEAGEVSRGLVLVDIAPRVNMAGVDRILGFMAAHPGGFSSQEEAAGFVAAYQPQRAQKSDPGGLRKNLRQHDDGRWYWHWDPAMLATFLKAWEDKSEGKVRADEERFYAAAEKLTQPVLLVRGTQSDVVDESITRDFCARIPQARVADVSGAGHMVAGDRNDVFLEVVSGFIEGI